MNPLTTLEKTLARLFAQAPHLSVNARRWVGENIWWIVLVIALASTLGLLGDLPKLLKTASMTAATYNVFYPYSAVTVGSVVASGLVTLSLGVVIVVLLFLAVTPLKEQRLIGWRLLLMTRIIAIISAIATFIILIQNFSLYGLLWDLAFILIELYILFEVRDEFRVRAVAAVAVKAAPLHKRVTTQAVSATTRSVSKRTTPARPTTKKASKSPAKKPSTRKK